jgi:putative endopeptidase
VTDQTAVADLGDLVPAESLEDWKLWMEFHFAHESFSDYLPKAFANSPSTTIRGSLAGLTGDSQRAGSSRSGSSTTRSAKAVGAALCPQASLPEPGYKADRSMPSSPTSAPRSKRGCKALDWMDDETRGAALEKLLALQGMIGYPDKWRDFSKYPVEPGKLVESIYASYEFEWNEQQADLGKPVDRTRWPTHAHVVNAFYNPLGNTFVLPAGILKPPFFDPGADPAVNYGGIGAVIGHEMSHGFDDQGRQFDASGRTFNWWTDETDELFVAKTNRLMRQYNGYCPFRDACVNGLGTLGENIGDLAGLEIAYAAYKLSLGGKEAPVIGGLTGDQRFFTAYASTYRDKVREEIARAMLEGDSHSPSRYRVNGVVRNMDAWYAAFDVKPGDRLYLSPAQRVRIW